MRTFIAIEIPDAVKHEMTDIQRRLNTRDIDASWPRPEGIHLTLKFLGEVPDAKLDDIKNGIAKACEGIEKFRIEIAGVGTFPNPKNARVVWVGLGGEPEKLGRLQSRVENEMTEIGMEREERPFKPHLTLARIKFVRSKENFLRALEQVKDVKLPGFEVSAVSVMKSELKRTGAVYTEMGRVELRQNQNLKSKN